MPVIVKDNSAKIDAAMKQLVETQVLVGVPAAKATRSPDDEHGASQEINNAALAYIHENGAPEVGIPARPFMTPGVESVKAKIVKGMANAARAVLDGATPQDINNRLNAVGLLAATAIKDKISEGQFEPLKPATLAARRRAGISGDAPLIAKGYLKDAITYVIRKRGKKSS